MTTCINHEDTIDLRILAGIALEQGHVLEDADADETERKEALVTLEALQSMLRHCGYDLGKNVNAEDISHALIRLLSKTSSTLIHEDHFGDFLETEIEECYPEIENLPSWVFIDWSKTIQAVKQGYTEVTLDGQVYFILID